MLLNLKISSIKISKIKNSVFGILMVMIAIPAMAQQTKMVGRAEMFQTKNIIENATNSMDHTTLVAAVKAADIVTTLQSKGPFTVFAPVNAAFDKLPMGTVDNLLMMENKTALQGVLTYHVIAGKLSAKDILKSIKMGKVRLPL
ncbi:MAG: putative surface protein with fasciclin (FAS1) repeats [Sediminicola sp.]